MIYIEVINEKVVYINYRPEEMGDTSKGILINTIPEPEQKEGYIPIPYYIDGKIVYEYEAIPQVPEEEEMPIPEIPYKEQVVNKIRERYSIDDELAILRQRDTKPEEFEAYNAYAESCKEEARLLIEKQKH